MMKLFPNPPLNLIQKCKTNQICVDDKLIETIDCNFCKNVDLRLLSVLCHTNEICVHYSDQHDDIDQTKYKFIDTLVQFVPHKTIIYIYPFKLDQTNTNHKLCISNSSLHNLKMYVYNTFKNQIYKTQYIHCDCKQHSTNQNKSQDKHIENQDENIDNQDGLFVCKIRIDEKKIEFIFTPICIHKCELAF